MTNFDNNQNSNEIKEAKVFIDSNLAENSNCFQQYDYHEAVFRDLTLFILKKKNDKALKTLRFHLADFYNEFGISKASLFNKINANLHKKAKAHGFEHIPTVIEWVLFKLHTQPISFVKFRSKQNAEIAKINKEAGYDVDLNLIRIVEKRRYTISKGREGTNPIIDIEPRILLNSKGEQYTPFLLSDYLRLKTDAGRPDQNLRKLFLRMAWKENIEKGKNRLSSTDNFVKLCEIANIKDKARNQANRLREMFDKINTNTTLTSRWEVRKEGKGYVVSVYKRKLEAKAA